MMRLLRSFAYAWHGLRTCFGSEANFKIHIFFAAMAILFGFGLNISGGEWLAILFCIAFVISMEMMNTAIEKLCNMVHRDVHPAVKAIKDIAAGAVMIAAVSAFIAGIIIFLPRIMNLVKTF